MKLIEYTYESRAYNGKYNTHTGQSIEILNHEELKLFAYSDIITQYTNWICEDIFHEKDGKIEVWVDHFSHSASRVALMKYEELFPNDIITKANDSNVYLEISKFKLRIAALDIILTSKEELVNAGNIIYVGPTLGFNSIKPKNIISEIEIDDINNIEIIFEYWNYKFQLKNK